MKKCLDMVYRGAQKTNRHYQIYLLGVVLFAIHGIVYTSPVFARKVATSSAYRQQEREKQSRLSEKYEYKRRTHQPFIQGKTSRTEGITRDLTAEKVRFRKYLADSHWGLRFYEHRTCIRCHPKQARNLHKVRAKITCRQCHGEEPIPGNSHYNSLMHPRRRYVLVCSKCHKGSSASFATYVVHEPIPIAKTTQKAFPLLFYCVWAMVALAVGTFAAFLPHTFLWGLREFFSDSMLTGLKDFLFKKRKQDEKD